MITKEQATEQFAQGFYRYTFFHHVFLKMADGQTPIKARRKGGTKTWKRDAKRFRIAAKIGLNKWIHITEKNADEWCVTAYEHKQSKT